MGDLLDFFSGKAFYEVGGLFWGELLKASSDILTADPSGAKYKDIWSTISSIYTTMNVIAAALLTLFFLYGFCRDSVDLHSDLTFDKTIKLFIRLIITSNLLSALLTIMPKLFSYASSLSNALLEKKNLSYALQFDGAKVYEDIVSCDYGVLTTTLTGILFLVFCVVCGGVIALTVFGRLLRIYMIAPFAGIAISTLAAGGRVSDVGYSYIKTFFAYTFSILLISVVIVIAKSFIHSISFNTNNGMLVLLEYCLKMAALSGSVKMADTQIQKAFGL